MISITYSSQTGNTKKLAEAIFMELFDKVSYLGTHSSVSLESDLLFVGFWTDKGVCDLETQNMLKKLKNKKIFLFGTCGTEDEDYFRFILENTASFIDPSNKILDSFMCQGNVKRDYIERYKIKLQEHPMDEEVIFQYNMLRSSIGHPDEQDIDKLKYTLRLFENKYLNS